MTYPLMHNNISKSDVNALKDFLNKKKIRFTQGKKVKEFEQKWSKWLGCKYSVFVNSGSSANLLSISLLKIKYPKGGEVIVPSHTWVSDIASVIQNGFKPVFVDIDLKHLGMKDDLIIEKITKNTKAVFLSYIQGFNCLTKKLLQYLKEKKIILIEDVCESHGALFGKKKLGSFGWTSNFSFYYAHHMTTIEGGMVCTNDKLAYNNLLMLRSHGMLRESVDSKIKKEYSKQYPDLNSNFIFCFPAYNVRNTEIGAVIGLNQLKRLDNNIVKRNNNLKYFLSRIRKDIYFTDFDLKGCSNYAFNIILKKPNKGLFNKVCKNLAKNKIEFRVGGAGGGNQLRQPYLRNKFNIKLKDIKSFKNTEQIHFYGFYIGNYPDLSHIKIDKLIKVLNSI